MRKFEKIYVGKGIQNENGLEIIKVNLKMSDLEKLIYEYDGQKYVTLEVARMKEADNYNKTHTVYGSFMVEETVAAPAKKKSTRKPKTTTEVQLPF